jgi:hypothetical protein
VYERLVHDIMLIAQLRFTEQLTLCRQETANFIDTGSRTLSRLKFQHENNELTTEKEFELAEFYRDKIQFCRVQEMR